MLIAQLIRYSPFGSKEMLYCAADPFDGERLTQWHDTISAVDDELIEKTAYALNLAAYAGESDVPARPSTENTEEHEHDGIACGCPAIPCH